MRKFAWLVPVVMMSFGGAALAEDAPAKKGKAAAPKLELVGDAKIALGEIKAGESKDVEIKLKNTGEGEAKAVACTGAGITWDKDKPTLAATTGEGTVKGKIVAPKKAPAKEIAKTIKVTCGKGKAAVKGIEVSYTVPAAEKK